MSTKRLAIRGVAWNWLARVCAFVIAFIVTPIVVHSLGNEAYGIWSIVMSLTTYYALADLGLRGAGVKYISQFEAVNDRDSINKVVVASLAVYILLALGVLLLAGGAALAFPLVFETGEHSISTLRWVVMLTGMNVALTILGQVFDAALVALKRFDLHNLVIISAQILLAVVIVLVLRNGGGLLAMAWVTLAVGILRQLCFYALTTRILRHLSLSPSCFQWKMLKTLIRFGSLNLVRGVARRITQSAGAIIIGIILGPAVVTFYAIAAAFVGKLGRLSMGITSVLMPVASQLDAQQRRRDLTQVFILVSRNVLALGLTLAIVLLALGWPLIDLWIGPGYATATYPVLCVLALAMMVQMFSNCARNMLVGMNHLGFLAKVALFDVAVTLALGVGLVKASGLVGMAYAVLVTQVVTAGVLIPAYACRVLDVSLGRFIRRVLVPGGAAALPGLAIAVTMAELAPPTRLIHIVVQAFCIALVTGVSTFFVCFNKQMRLDILRSLLRHERSSPQGRTRVPADQEFSSPANVRHEDTAGMTR